jgi:DNA-binding helix-hairpin-helix protein with protein kinase domain
MTTATEATKQYVDFVQQGQAATLKAVETWTRTVKDFAAQAPGVAVPETAQQAVDQIYDLAGRLLEVQRGFVKDVLANAGEAVETAAAWTPRIVDEK